MFYGRFDSKNDICHQFQIEESDLKGCTILFAAYDGGYDGTALVVFRRNRKLYEVNGAHCSCYGLQGQWEPEVTTVQALRHRVEKGTLGYHLGAYDQGFRWMLDGLSRKGKTHQS
jgi:hypothetical protein